MPANKKGVSAGTSYASDQYILVSSILSPKRGDFIPPYLRGFLEGGG